LPEPSGKTCQVRATAVATPSAGARHMITVSDVRDVVRRHESILAPEPGGGVEARPAGPRGAAAPTAAYERADCQAAVCRAMSYRDLTAAYFRFLVRKAAGRLPEVARLAGISKATVYEWRDKYDEERGGEGD
jgi:hypothetical protein